MKIHFDIWNWGLLCGRLSTSVHTVNAALIGPFEVSWGERPGLKEDPEVRRLWWLWSLSRVFLLDLVRVVGAANGYGVSLAFDPDDPGARALRFQFRDYTLSLGWFPANVPYPRLTMREKRREARASEMADQFLQLLQQAMEQGGPSGPTPDFRGNPNLN